MQGTSYEPFSQEPEYLELNREFIKSLPLRACRTVLDIACGTGTLSETILDVAPLARVVGLDIDREQLQLASRHLRAAAGRTAFVEASADALPLKDGSADAAVMGNAIHNLPDARRLLAEIRRVLRPKGFFSFSTSFYAGTFAPGTERFYLAWMKEALKRLREAAGHGAAPRVRGTVPHASSRPWLSADDYRRLFEENGFGWEKSFERPVTMTQRSFETVGAYSGLARVLLSGYPVEQACAALSAAAGDALKSSNLEVVPRLWLEVCVTRSA